MIDRDEWKRLEDYVEQVEEQAMRASTQGLLSHTRAELGYFLRRHSRELRETLERQEAEIERLEKLVNEGARLVAFHEWGGKVIYLPCGGIELTCLYCHSRDCHASNCPATAFLADAKEIDRA